MIIDKKPASSGSYGPFCLLSYYSSDQGQSLETFEIEDPHTEAFRNSSPMKFDIQQETCTGTWKVAKTDIQLIEGSCPQHIPTTYRSLINTAIAYI